MAANQGADVNDDERMLRRLGRVDPPRDHVVDGAVQAVSAAAAESVMMGAGPRADGFLNGTETPPNVPISALRPRRRVVWGTVAAAAAVAAIVVVVISPWSVTRQVPDVVATGSGALLAGLSGGSCGQLYDRQALDDSEFAFDGTITAIDSGGLLFTNSVTFAVDRWFRGDLGSAVTAAMTAPVEMGATSEDGRQATTPTYSVGTRLLVAGAFEDSTQPSAESALVWQCGFTRDHDDSTAAEWAAALD